ncbi:Lrp/AsnC family transcriptional regulator [Maribacter sp. 2307ULW6-5]|uniref:Lrp/AsnC family transcriptional regulator n=1 Tax=Maribacter sp. 2307ULW6-5 TaxID=3386275 RepID=UPI0039BCC5AD
MDALDETDRAILAMLTKNAKVGAKAIAETLGLTKTPVYERIRRLEQEGYIKKYVAVLDGKKMDRGITVFSFVSLEAQKGALMDHFLNEVMEFKEVRECHVVGGEFDFLLRIQVRDLDAYYDFAKSKIASLPHMGSVKSAFVLNTTKWESHQFLP